MDYGDEGEWEEMDYFPTDEFADMDFEDWDYEFDFYDLPAERNETANHTEDWELPSTEYDYFGDEWDAPTDDEYWGFDEYEEDLEQYEYEEYTDDWGREYQNYTDDEGTSTATYTDEWGTEYYDSVYRDGSSESCSFNEQEGWRSCWRENADGSWSSDYSTFGDNSDGYWSTSEYDPLTGREVFASGDDSGEMRISYTEEDGAWAEEIHHVNGTIGFTRYELDGSVT